MALAAADLLGGVVAARPALLGGLDRLAVDDAGRGLGRLALVLANAAVHHAQHLVPDARLAPAVELGGDGAPGREVVGQAAPLAAGGQDVQDGIDQVLAGDDDGVTGLGPAFGQQRADRLPLLVREVAGIHAPLAHARIIGRGSICKPPLSPGGAEDDSPRR